MLHSMDSRVSQSPEGALEELRREGGPWDATVPHRKIDAATHDAVEWTVLSRELTARLDAILSVPSRDRARGFVAPDHEQAVRAWTTVLARPSERVDGPDRRAALATTVLRIGLDGRLDRVDDGVDGGLGEGGAADDASAQQATGDAAATAAAPSDSEDVRAATATSAFAATRVPARHDGASPDQAEGRGEQGRGTAESTFRDDARTNERLAAVRRRMATRRAADGSPLDRMALFRRRGVRRALQRLLIVAAIIGATAVVSLLMT
jgi:hypothetical protein